MADNKTGLDEGFEEVSLDSGFEEVPLTEKKKPSTSVSTTPVSQPAKPSSQSGNRLEGEIIPAEQEQFDFKQPTGGKSAGLTSFATDPNSVAKEVAERKTLVRNNYKSAAKDVAELTRSTNKDKDLVSTLITSPEVQEYLQTGDVSLLDKPLMVKNVKLNFDMSNLKSQLGDVDEVTGKVTKPTKQVEQIVEYKPTAEAGNKDLEKFKTVADAATFITNKQQEIPIAEQQIQEQKAVAKEKRKEFLREIDYDTDEGAFDALTEATRERDYNQKLARAAATQPDATLNEMVEDGYQDFIIKQEVEAEKQPATKEEAQGLAGVWNSIKQFPKTAKDFVLGTAGSLAAPIATSAAAAAAGFNPLVGVGYFTYDSAEQAYGASLQNNYNILRQKYPNDPQRAFTEAKELALISGAITATTMPVGMLGGGVANRAVSRAIQKQAVSKIIPKLAGLAAEANTFAAVATAGKYVENKVGMEYGTVENATDGLTENYLHSVAVPLLLSVAHSAPEYIARQVEKGGVSRFTMKDYEESITALGTIPLEEFTASVDYAAKNGALTPEKQAELTQKYTLSRKALEKIPDNMGAEKTIELRPLIEQKDALLKEAEGIDEQLLPFHNEKLQEVEAKIKEVADKAPTKEDVVQEPVAPLVDEVVEQPEVVQDKIATDGETTTEAQTAIEETAAPVEEVAVIEQPNIFEQHEQIKGRAKKQAAIKEYEAANGVEKAAVVADIIDNFDSYKKNLQEAADLNKIKLEIIC